MAKVLSATADGIAIVTAAQAKGWRERLLVAWFKRITVGHLSVRFSSGATMTFSAPKPGPKALMKINDLRLVTRLLVSGDLGLAESYMAREWEAPDLTSLLKLGALNEVALSNVLAENWWSRMFGRLVHACHSNTKAGSRRNIAAHYDLGNSFYAGWLDETMSYSAAMFESFEESHEIAQHRKYHRLAQKLNLRPGDRILEIGCGWGGFAEIAARDYGCKVLGITLSQEQAAFARKRLAGSGLSDKVEIRLQDYRDVIGKFDHIVSIEMFEAVGESYWLTYMNALKKLLKPQGRAALQIITIDDKAYEKYRKNPDFIQRYVFPGGMLPSPERLMEHIETAGLNVTDTLFFGASYAESLRRWDKAFVMGWDNIKKLGFDERFRLLWRYYLSYCEVGFDTGHIDVGHFILENS